MIKIEKRSSQIKPEDNLNNFRKSKIEKETIICRHAGYAKMFDGFNFFGHIWPHLLFYSNTILGILPLLNEHLFVMVIYQRILAKRSIFVKIVKFSLFFRNI